MRSGLLNIAALASMIGVAASAHTVDVTPGPEQFAALPGGSPSGPIHRRGRFKRNARRQMGRKTLPRKS